MDNDILVLLGRPPKHKEPYVMIRHGEIVCREDNGNALWIRSGSDDSLYEDCIAVEVLKKL